MLIMARSSYIHTTQELERDAEFVCAGGVRRHLLSLLPDFYLMSLSASAHLEIYENELDSIALHCIAFIQHC